MKRDGLKITQGNKMLRQHVDMKLQYFYITVRIQEIKVNIHLVKICNIKW